MEGRKAQEQEVGVWEGVCVLDGVCMRACACVVISVELSDVLVVAKRTDRQTDRAV